MTADAPHMKPPSKTGYVFGGLSFIPGLGIIFGVVAIAIGATKRDGKIAILGLAGIAFSVVLYGCLFYFGFVAKTGPFADLRLKLAAQMITTDAGQIALYKQRHGSLPKTLADIPTSRQTPFLALDPWLKPLAYKQNEDGTFELRSAGPDGVFNTADDIAQTF